MSKKIINEPLYFYTSKTIYLFAILVGLLFIVIGGLLSNEGLQLDDGGLTGIGVFIILLSITLTTPIIKRLLTNQPYIIITKETLIINQPFKGRLSVNWYDIRHFQMITAQMTKLIFVLLNNEEKYYPQMTRRIFPSMKPKRTMGLSPIWIVWRQVKKKDQECLVHVLDQYTNIDPFIYDRLAEQFSNREMEMSDFKQINSKYFLKGYGYSLAITIAAFLFLYLIGDNLSEYIPIFSVSLLLFPFAKVIFDVVIGFKINFYLKKETIADQFLFPLMMLVYGLIYMFSIYIAPFGMLYMILRAFYQFFKRNRK